MLRHVLTISLVAVAGIAALLGGGWLYFLNFAPDPAKYPVRGIDVSRHQGTIDWRAVSADNVRFAYLKASEGGDMVDTTFAANLAAAQSAGIAVGAYHFFTFCRPGADQAANFLATVPRGIPMLPPVVDIEYSGNCSTRPTVEAMARELDAFIAPVEAAFGRPVLLYVMGDALETYREAIPQRVHWVRWLAMEPWEPGWAFWQYHDRGHVAGIDGEVDLNVFSGSAADLSALVR